MDGKKDFQQWLEEKMGTADSHKAHSTSHARRPQAPPAHRPLDHPHRLWTVASLFTEGPKRTFRPSENPYPKIVKKRRPQASKQRTKSHQTAKNCENVASPERPREKSVSFFQLSAKGQEAFRRLQNLGALLDKDTITLSVIKREFRRLAKTFHPDRFPGKADQFIKLKTNHGLLSESLKSLL